MKKQIIVTIGRESGSGGHFIGELLAEKMGVKMYDRKMLDHLGIDDKITKKYDEKKINFFTSKRIKGHSNSIEEILAEKQFEFIKEHADSGESFVVVGRCAEHVLKDNPNALKVFIMGDMHEKCARMMKVYQLTEKEAIDKIKRHDKRRRAYHNSYCDFKWGDSRGYDVCINSTKFGIEGTTDIIFDMTEKFKTEV